MSKSHFVFSLAATFLGFVSLVSVAQAQCPKRSYNERDREVIRESVILPAADRLLAAQNEADYVVSDDQTFTLESDERAYRQLIEEVRSQFSSLDNVRVTPRSKRWILSMGEEVSALVSSTSLIPAEENMPPKLQALESSRRIGWTIRTLLACF